jgi:hypothetical protein
MKIGASDNTSQVLPASPTSASSFRDEETGLMAGLRFPITEVVVLAGYLFLTVLMTWPTVLHLTEAIPGDGFDGWQNYWNLWWVKQALLVERTSPYFTTYLDAPSGVSLLFHTLNIFNGFWTLPIQLNSGLAPAYNAVVFASFVLAGYGAYLLALHTLARFLPAGRALRPAAFVGGLVFTMSPFHMAHLLGHMQVFSMIWPPFYVLWLLRTLEPWSAGIEPPIHRWRNAAICSLFLILASLVAWYHTLYLLIFTGLVLLWTVWRRWRLQSQDGAGGLHRLARALQPLPVGLVIGLGFVVVLSPVLIPMVRAASARPDLETGLVQNITLSADLLAFITPSEMHPLWGEWARGIADNFSSTTSERLIFAGFVPLALALYIVIRAWTGLIVRFWLLITAIFFVISLGPFLHIGGEILAFGGWQIPMPYLLLYYTVPFIDLTRSLSRYDLMVMLGLGVLVSLALGQLMNRQPQAAAPGKAQLPGYTERIRRSSHVLPLVVALLICFEFLPVPYPISKIDTPQFYLDTGADTDDYTIAELPMNWDRPTPLLHQTSHGKPLLTAYTSRDNPLELAGRTPVFQQWQNLGPDIIDQPLAQIAPTILSDFDLRYVVLDFWQMPPGPERSDTEHWVSTALPDAAPVYDDGRLIVYRAPSPGKIYPYLSLGEGWSDRQEQGNGVITRRFSASQTRTPELLVHHPGRDRLSLEITAAAEEAGQALTILAEDKPIGTLRLGSVLASHTIPLPQTGQAPLRLRLRAGIPGGEVVVSRLDLSYGD